MQHVRIEFTGEFAPGDEALLAVFQAKLTFLARAKARGPVEALITAVEAAVAHHLAEHECPGCVPETAGGGCVAGYVDPPEVPHA